MATGNSTAFYYLDQGNIGGAIVPIEGIGFRWTLVGVFRERQTNRKSVVSGIEVITLDTDGVAEVRAKLAAGVKAKGLEFDYNVTVVAGYPLEVTAV